VGFNDGSRGERFLAWARIERDGEKYTVARRMVIARRDPGQLLVVSRVYLNPQCGSRASRMLITRFSQLYPRVESRIARSRPRDLAPRPLSAITLLKAVSGLKMNRVQAGEAAAIDLFPNTLLSGRHAMGQTVA
jgi:hypothetical protein